MKKGKLIPIVITVILALIIIYLISSKSILNKVKQYKHFEIIFNKETTNYDNIKISDVIIINNVSFWVTGIEGDKIVFDSSEDFNGDEEGNAFTVKLDEPKDICFTETSCATFKLT